MSQKCRILSARDERETRGENRERTQKQIHQLTYLGDGNRKNRKAKRIHIYPHQKKAEENVGDVLIRRKTCAAN
jgi:hypothetical protein